MKVDLTEYEMGFKSGMEIQKAYNRSDRLQIGMYGFYFGLLLGLFLSYIVS